MPQRDDDFTPYQDRPLPWEGRSDAAPRRAPSGGGGCLRGCGCALVVLIALSIAGFYAIRDAPARVGVGILKSIVDGAIEGQVRVNDEVVTTPAEWHEPWRETVDAYGAAFRAGHVSPGHFADTLWQHLGTTLSSGGEIPGEDIRALCEHMRGALPAADAGGLPLLPEPATPLQATPVHNATADDAVQDAPAGETPWPPRAALDPAERARQYRVRRSLLETLSRKQGPAVAQRLVPDSAIIYDFQYDTPPYVLLMDGWTVGSPSDRDVEPGWDEHLGYSAPASMYLTVQATGRLAEGKITFTTTAGTFQFWYLFYGQAVPASALTVFVDGTQVHTDTWPTSLPRTLAGNEWQHVHVTGLGTHGHTEIEIRVNADSSNPTLAATVFFDDFVFTP